MAKCFLAAAGARVREEEALGADGGPSARVSELLERAGGRSLPIVVIGDAVISGFSPVAYENALARVKA